MKKEGKLNFLEIDFRLIAFIFVLITFFIILVSAFGGGTATIELKTPLNGSVDIDGNITIAYNVTEIGRAHV